MKRWHKFLIIFAVLGLAVAGLNFIYGFKAPRPSGNPNLTISSANQAIIDRLLAFEIKDPNLPADRREKFQKLFEETRDAFNKIYSQNGGKGNEVGFYKPLLNLGVIHREVGDYQKAADAFLYANRISPKAYVPLGDLGDLYYRYIRDYQKAVYYYEEAIQIKGEYIGTYYGDLYELYQYRLKDPKKAEALLINGIADYPEETDILGLLARHYEMVGEREEAISRFRELLTKDPSSVVAKEGLQRLGAQ